MAQNKHAKERNRHQECKIAFKYTSLSVILTQTHQIYYIHIISLNIQELRLFNFLLKKMGEKLMC